MLPTAPLIACCFLGVLTTIAAATDAATGRIPNSLTLPSLVLAPLVAAPLAGLPAAGGALGGIVACGAAPLVLHRTGACGGGDVKLLAALGGFAGAGVGLEIQLVGLSLACLYGLARRALHRWRRGGSPTWDAATAVRLGPWIGLATAVVLGMRLAVVR